VEWNKRTYDTHKANCQHFVHDALEAMGIKIPTEGALGKQKTLARTLLPHLPLFFTINR